jgi:hypothetical protein
MSVIHNFRWIDMGTDYHKVYTVMDIYEAFNRGLPSAVFVLEKSFELPDEDSLHMLEGQRRIVDRKMAYNTPMGRCP